MKTLQFNFDHPVKGNACLVPADCERQKTMRFTVQSEVDNSLNIPVGECKAGQWTLILDWQYEGRLFSHREKFTI
ncbi:hypothetical protein D0C36_23985 [Mucilaginibacter conchicola]|uniref:Uncharacterized protein n=1 Tax=Mucilaginibacter conchicola TaxID=2303333 RepID=A0A372NLX7_9SPHI|nr:hypothetical protein [Mucilaginibacter conchicola]RFZ89959.1 hypothetical protein D0C36_23985 [Mucilaginibacter conchicola]